jgi:hypothetical protein
MKYSCRDEKAEVRPKDPFYSRANHLQPCPPFAEVSIFFSFFCNRPESRGTHLMSAGQFSPTQIRSEACHGGTLSFPANG